MMKSIKTSDWVDHISVVENTVLFSWSLMNKKKNEIYSLPVYRKSITENGWLIVISKFLKQNIETNQYIFSNLCVHIERLYR